MMGTVMFEDSDQDIFNPNDEITREQVVFMINRLTDRQQSEPKEQPFTDILESDEYYLDIESAATKHIKKNND